MELLNLLKLLKSVDAESSFQTDNTNREKYFLMSVLLLSNSSL